MIGLDTGFFIKLLRNDLQATKVFESTHDDTDLCVSCLTFFELKRLSLKGAVEQNAIDTLIESILSLCRISWLDNKEIHDIAASLSYGLGIPAIDSLILAGFISNGSETIYTTDPHMGKYTKKGVQVIKL
ncbi:MAG: type II toxin-antitoxin system VapC family toxin [Deltaproteobacteria bacterium]|nr:type II toxin-antitoxin system VapC family toxin [Deltaproteobacteria bacterium]